MDLHELIVTESKGEGVETKDRQRSPGRNLLPTKICTRCPSSDLANQSVISADSLVNEKESAPQASLF